MRTFRLPTPAYLAVLILLFCVIPLAFAGNGSGSAIDRSTEVGGLTITPLIVLLAIPVLATLYIARTATFITEDGIKVRAMFGSRELPWASIRGLVAEKRSVYAVVDRGAVRLPCVKVSDLHDVAEASGGHLPDIDAPKPKFAPSRRRR